MKRLFTYLAVVSFAMFLVGCGATKTIPTQSDSSTYKVGDMYNQNGLQGVVVKVDATGQHGLIMSLEGSNETWTADKKFDFETNAFYEDDGQKNMEALAKYIESGNASWSDFPVFNWARSLGEGWYIPAKDEAAEIWKNMNGGANAYKWSARFVKNDFQKFDHAQREYGGAKLIDDRFQIGTNEPYLWYTSTEGEGGNAYAYQFEKSVKGELTKGFGTTKFAAFLTPKHRSIGKSVWNSRAIHKF